MLLNAIEKPLTDRDKIARYYDDGAQAEFVRLLRSPLHEAEWQLCIELMDEYIAPGSAVLDVGAGPGRYAEYFLKERDCTVGLVDLSQASLDKFNARIGSEHRDKVLFTWKSCATELAFIPAASFDAVLLMGPLYHLLEEEERQSGIGQCHRVLRPGGHIFATFISPYPVLPRLLTHDPALLGDPDFIDQLLDHGTVTSTSVTNMTEHFRCWPSRARAMLEEGHFHTLRLRNLEGVGTFFKEEQREVLAEAQKRQAWFDILRRTCEKEELLGATIHFLYLGEKRP